MANEANQYIPLQSLDRVNAQGEKETAELYLYTHKYGDGGVISMASVHFVGNGYRVCELFGDYGRRMKLDRAARATQKAIDTQHAEVFTPDTIAEILKQVTAHYEGKKAK